MWPEASRVRVFMLVPGVEIPHLCAQCHDYPCVAACPVNALSVSEETIAVLVDAAACTGCGQCIPACPGQVPFLHPATNTAVICDLCDGAPECVAVCQEARFDALVALRERKDRVNMNRKLFAQPPEAVTADVAVNLFGEKAEELL
jgi:Fe-S-cluster-containing hydrogenase component 2